MTYGMIFWLGRVLRSPRLWVIAVVLFGVLWVRATLATHDEQGHAGVLWDPFAIYNLPAKLVLGDVGLAPLTVSMHPGNGIDAGSHQPRCRRLELPTKQQLTELPRIQRTPVGRR